MELRTNTNQQQLSVETLTSLAIVLNRL